MDLNHFKQEPGLAQFIKSESALFVKEEILDVSKQDGNEQQYVQDTSTPGCTGSVKEAGSMNLDNVLNVKCELVDLEVRPIVPQHMDKHYIINKNLSAEHTEENTIVDDYNKPIPCCAVKKESIEDNLRVAADITYKCDKCLRAFKSKVKLNKHHQRMHETESHRCTECKKEFKCREYLSNHLNRTHSKSRRRLAILRSRVHKTAVSTMEYVASKPVMDQAHMEKTMKIEVEEAASSTAYIDSEIYINRLKQEPQLEQLNKSELLEQAEILEDSRQVSPDITYKCDKCLRAFKSKEKLKKHHQRIHETEPHKCTECNKEFKCREYLRNHLDSAHSKQQFECAICKRMCKSKRVLTLHRSSEHKPADITYKCDKCLLTFNSKKTLKSHHHRMHGTESHKCTKCNKEFKCRMYLRNHLNVTHSKQQFECAICKRVFKYKRALTLHRSRVHKPAANSSEQEIECAICKRVFKSKRALTLHRSRMHKPAGSRYTCDYCQKKFWRKQSLRRHIRNTHGERVHRCQKCKKIFSSRHHLQRHKTNIHDKPQCECGVCHILFESSYILKAHVKKIHGLDYIQSKSDLLSQEVHDPLPAASVTSAVVGTVTQQDHMETVKSEPADVELELGPVVFQHMDFNYRPLKEELQLD